MRSVEREYFKEEIKYKSKQDTIEGVEFRAPSKSIIPVQLYKVLINDVKPYEKMSEDEENYHYILSHLSKFKNLTIDIYWYIFKLVLYLEHYQSVIEMKQYNLYNQTIKPSKNREKEYLICIPGLSENRSLRVHDELEARKIENYLGKTIMNNRVFGRIKFIGNNYVSVSFSGGFEKTYQPNAKYDIEFYYYAWTNNNLNRVLDKVYNQQLKPILFPIKQISYNKKQMPIRWTNESIKNNPEQKQAVTNILNKTAHPAPYILFGPPGTGKTSTLIEAICQIVKSNSSNRVLICTPSNAAADEIAIRLFEKQIDKNIMYRMYGASMNINNVNKNIRTFSNFSSSQSIFVSKNVFLQKKIVITTLSSCVRLYKYNLRENHFAYLFCDEAGQATETETLIPLVLLSGAYAYNLSQFSAQIVLAGDPKQLGPVILSRLAEPLLGQSMLERLTEWGPYKKNELSKKYDPMYITKLLRNYRSHPAILRVPNELFYDGELIAKAGNASKRGENWSQLPNKKFPVIFHAIHGDEKRQSDSKSVYNQTEVDVVLDYVSRLLTAKLGGKMVNQNDIGIITPYKLQQMAIRKALQKKNYDEISTGTVESFQGQERDIIIISSVRTKLYMKKNCVHIGHLSNPKRFNVAITRARALLIAIGDPKILEHDNSWRTFIQYCIDNKSCRGDKFTLNTKWNHLEIRKLIAEQHNVQSNNGNQGGPIVELPEPESDSVEDKNRRRRLPVGPIPESFKYNLDSLNSSEKDNIHNKITELQNFTIRECSFIDSDEDSCSETNMQYDNGDDMDDDESDCDYFSTTESLQLSSPCEDYALNEAEDNFDLELQNRMCLLGN
ncbi:hypothetical protein PV328_003665 [Microctonus aethiopoides]|uniref:RNA helicase n=1 Tax=Microctonus aethiopoides TaxID=144406 RepID=A0AA39KKS1_9HYME|nr:hypothetical protein PV328_003665 [Microctonus aethiopoides]